MLRAGTPTPARGRRTGACRGPAAPDRPAGAVRRPGPWPAVDELSHVAAPMQIEMSACLPRRAAGRRIDNRRVKNREGAGNNPTLRCDVWRFKWSRKVGDGACMPIISTFFGITVRMYFADHGPPHVHVDYQGQEALVAIADGGILLGELPKRARALVRQWCLDHRIELEQNWADAQALRPLARIPGADND